MQSTYKKRIKKQQIEELKEDLKLIFWAIVVALALVQIHSLVMGGLEVITR